jgi:hypothetical protein
MHKYFLIKRFWFELIRRIMDVINDPDKSNAESRIIEIVRSVIVRNAEARVAESHTDDIYGYMPRPSSTGRFLPVTPAENLLRSSLIADVVARGDFFAVDLETNTLTILKR